MEIICKICHKPFEWHRKPRQRGGRIPKICLSAECRKLRDHLCYLKWKENHTYSHYEQSKVKILCAVCPTWFISKTSNHKYCSPECAAIGQSLSFQKWKKNNPEKYKENQRKKAKERKTSGGEPKSEGVAYRNTPQPKQYPCQRCGQLSNNRINCPSCLKILSEGCSQEYPNMVYDAGVDVSDVRSIKDGLRYDNQ